MSQMMNALKSSEQGYKEHSMSAFNGSTSYLEEKGRRIRWYHAALVIIPGTVTLAWLGYQSVLKQQLKISEALNLPPSVEQVSAPFERLDYPEFGKLKTTYIDGSSNGTVVIERLNAGAGKSSGSNNQLSEVPVPNKSAVKPVNQPEAIDWDGVDLSELSPALAMRVQSAMEADTGAEGLPSSATVSSAMSLTQHADQFIGKIPEMNFQTHVYASDSHKRWIKMNGVEYQEGDQLFDGVQLIAINPQTTLIRFEQQLIEVPALYHWKG